MNDIRRQLPRDGHTCSTVPIILRVHYACPYCGNTLVFPPPVELQGKRYEAQYTVCSQCGELVYATEVSNGTL